jgi:hypothetical protein
MGSGSGLPQITNCNIGKNACMIDWCKRSTPSTHIYAIICFFLTWLKKYVKKCTRENLNNLQKKHYFVGLLSNTFRNLPRAADDADSNELN